MCGFSFIAQLVEYRTGIAEVMGSNPVEALIFFQASSFQLLKLENLLRWSHFTFIYIDVLPKLVKSYNNTYHRSIKMKPSQVTEANEAKVWDTLYGSDVQKRVRFKFQVGDRVRISKVKRMFEKSYLPNYTKEMFTIYKRFVRQVPVYKLKDDAGEILEGTFYEPELQKIIKNYDVYRVEKILRKRKRKGVVEYLVKWKGYADKFNSWVSERDILKL